MSICFCAYFCLLFMRLQIDSLVTLPAKCWRLQGREEVLLRTVTSLAWKCLFLSLSSLCPPTEIFVAKSLYFGPCKNLCLSMNWWIDRQNRGGTWANVEQTGSSRSTEYAGEWKESDRQKEWHTVVRMSLGTEVQELSQKTGSSVSVI